MEEVYMYEYPDGTKEYRNESGFLHCEDGPAIILSNGKKFWYIQGLRLTQEEYQELWIEKKLKI